MVQTVQTIGKLLKTRLEKSSDKNAIGWIENNEIKHLTFQDYYSQIEILAAALKKLGLTSQEKVALLAQTCKEWHLLDMAVLSSRAIVVPIYPSYLPEEVEHIFTHSDSSVLIIESDKQFEKINSSKLKNLKLIISIHEVSEENKKKVRNKIPLYSYSEIQKIGIEEVKANPDILENLISEALGEEIASIVYTSGTTGEPKGAVITQEALVAMLSNVEKTIKGAINHQDQTLVFLPLSHVLGRTDSFLPLVFGSEAVYAESIEKLMENLLLVRPTIMIAVPRIFEKIYAKIMDKTTEGSLVEKKVFKWARESAAQYFEKIDKDLSPSTKEIIEYNLAKKIVFSKIYDRFGGRIRYFVSGGAPLSAEIIKFLRFANLTILEGYGLTETIAPCCLNPLAKQIPGTVGRPMGDVKIDFAPDGEILVQSKALMREYYKNPEATAEAMEEGWFHTGDIGEFTPEGFLRITDRKKDIIITSGGKNVAPQKIENLAKTQPHISQLIVIGEKKNYLTALVGIEKESFLPLLEELELPSDCTLVDIARHPKVKEIIGREIEEVNAGLAQYESIKKFTIIPEEFTTENFLTPSLKIKRKVVSEQFKREIEAMY